MTKTSKWIVGAILAIAIVVGVAIAAWRLAPTPRSPNEDAMVAALKKLGCDDAFATHRSMDGTEKGPDQPVGVQCTVHQGGPQPTCDAVHATWRSITRSTLPALVSVRGPQVGGCLQSYDANGAPAASSP